MISNWVVYNVIELIEKRKNYVFSKRMVNKRFILDTGVVNYYMEDYEDWYQLSDSVSRFVFDLILGGIKEKGFTQLFAEK